MREMKIQQASNGYIVVTDSSKAVSPETRVVHRTEHVLYAIMDFFEGRTPTVGGARPDPSSSVYEGAKQYFGELVVNRDPAVKVVTAPMNVKLGSFEVTQEREDHWIANLATEDLAGMAHGKTQLEATVRLFDWCGRRLREAANQLGLVIAENEEDVKKDPGQPGGSN